jgi:DNA-binding NarL/FixJ family response regulator
VRRCLIADDHAMMRDALATTVAARWHNAEIVQASDFPGAWALAADGADICLVDLDMPGASARDGVAGLRAAAHDMPLLVITGTDDDAMMLDLLALGVAGFAPKTLTAAVIGAAIELVLAGGRYLPPRLAELHAAPHDTTAPRDAASARLLLTARQQDVLRLLVQGLSNKDIARALHVAPATIKSHVAQVIALTGGVNRTDASMRAQRMGLV